MAEYRHYFLDHDGHVEARAEFSAPDDETALQISACVAAASDDMHSGFMLWRGISLLREAKKIDGLASRAISAAKLNARSQDIALDFEHRLLESHWSIARSIRLLDATRDLESIAKLRDGG